MTRISDEVVYLLAGALALGLFVGVATLAHALHRARTRPLGVLARSLALVLVPAFAALATASLLEPAGRAAFGVLAALLALSLVLDARHPGQGRRLAAPRRVAAAVAIALGALLLVRPPVEAWWSERDFAQRQQEESARRASPEHGARVARDVAACAREDEDGTACFEHGFGYRQDADVETARLFFEAACERGHETACSYAQDL